MNGLLVDDDAGFLRAMQRNFEIHGIRTSSATNSAAALEFARAMSFDFALLDLNIGPESGLHLIRPLKEISDAMRIVMVTAYASVATAMEAIKAGADDYLLKPVSVPTILRILTDQTSPAIAENDSLSPLNRIEWEHIQQALRATDGNVCAAADLLGVHRRTLQRKLAKG